MLHTGLRIPATQSIVYSFILYVKHSVLVLPKVAQTSKDPYISAYIYSNPLDERTRTCLHGSQLSVNHHLAGRVAMVTRQQKAKRLPLTLGRRCLCGASAACGSCVHWGALPSLPLAPMDRCSEGSANPGPALMLSQKQRQEIRLKTAAVYQDRRLVLGRVGTMGADG